MFKAKLKFQTMKARRTFLKLTRNKKDLLKRPIVEFLFKKDSNKNKANEAERKMFQNFQVDPWISNYIKSRNFTTKHESFDIDSDLEELEVEKKKLTNYRLGYKIKKDIF